MSLAYYRALMNQQEVVGSTKRPFYDGVNDYSDSSFTVYDWLGVADGTPTNLTEGILFDFTYKCDTPPATRYEMGGVSPKAAGYSGFLWWTSPFPAFVFNLYSEIFIQPIISGGITWFDGVERRITFHVRFSGGTMFVKVYVNGSSVYSSSNASTYIFFEGISGSKMSLSKWNAADPNTFNYAQFYKQVDLFNIGNYSDAQVASYLSDRNALNSDLYARFLLDEGDGSISYADNDASKTLTHNNITLPDFWQEY